MGERSRWTCRLHCRRFRWWRVCTIRSNSFSFLEVTVFFHFSLVSSGFGLDPEIFHLISPDNGTLANFKVPSPEHPLIETPNSNEFPEALFGVGELGDVFHDVRSL